VFRISELLSPVPACLSLRWAVESTPVVYFAPTRDVVDEHLVTKTVARCCSQCYVPRHPTSSLSLDTKVSRFCKRIFNTSHDTTKKYHENVKVKVKAE